jgi:hypothetical protein
VYNDKKYTYNRKTGYKSNKAFFLSPSSIRRVAALYAAQTTPRTCPRKQLVPQSYITYLSSIHVLIAFGDLLTTSEMD